MFKNLQETIKALNADVKNITNCDKAKNLRKKLLQIGLPMAIGGFIGVFICFALFATAGGSAMGANGFSSRIMVPFLLIIPCAVVGAIGARLTSLGFKIVIAGYATNLIDEAVGNNCPNCKSTIESGMAFCAKCGTKIQKECANCNHINGNANAFCEKCGHKLD